jgi:D-alanyl-D-alanine carboxypeptidase
MKKSITVSEIPPKVSAKSWIVYDMQQNKSLWKHRSHKQREMASLTKMMNLITILELMNSLGVDAREVRVRASKSACEITGTTA